MFIIFINDLPDNLQNEVYMFADDTKVFSLVNNLDDAMNLQNDLTELENWSRNWLLSFNASKCKVLHLGKEKSGFRYQLNNTILEATDCEKDLGVHIDDKLDFSKHIDTAINRANRTMGTIRRVFRHLDRSNFLKLYKGLVRPILEYAVQVWHPYLKKDMRKVEGVQRRATKQINDLNILEYSDRLLKLQLPTLLYRRMRGDMVEVYKILTAKYDPAVSTFLPLHKDKRPGSVTRGNSLKLYKRQATHLPCRNSFSHRVVDWWNSLPDCVITAPTTKTFEIRLDRHWMNLVVKYDFDTAIQSDRPLTALTRDK